MVVEGYRPGSMERNGLGREAILNLVKDRGRGIIHVRENCYGWHGPWKHRSGWQQISDAVGRRPLVMATMVLTFHSVVVFPCDLARRWGIKKLSHPFFQTRITGWSSYNSGTHRANKRLVPALWEVQQCCMH